MVRITPIRTGAEQALMAQFPKSSSAARQSAIDSFMANGLPHRRIEAYHYTDLRSLIREVPVPAGALGQADIVAVPEKGVLSEVEAITMTFVNGHFAPELSALDDLPDGIMVSAISDAEDGDTDFGSVLPASDDAVIALNTAFNDEVLLLAIEPGLVLQAPLHLRFVTRDDVAASPRVLMSIGDGASLTVLETHEGGTAAPLLANTVVELHVGDDVTLHHVRVNATGAQATDLSTLGVRLGARVKMTSVTFVADALLARHQVFMRFDGEDSVATLGGATLIKGRQHTDTTLVVDHSVPNCQSRERFSHVLDGEATGVFQGKIIVRPHAQKTDGKMMSRAVVLHDGASMNNKPELEIFADDVQCGHGATVGALDDDLLFYLRARGLPKAEAEALMLQAFIGEALELVAHDGIRDALVDKASQWFSARL